MSAHPTISVTDALQENRLFAPFFAGPSWNTWSSVLKAAFAERLNKAEIETFRSVAERDPPQHRVEELVCIAGRGAGKNSIASFIAAHVSMSFDPKASKLRPGELAYVMCLAVDKDQSGVVFRYIKALFEEIPVLKAMVKGKIGSDSIELKNRVVIQVAVNSYRSVRGRSILCTIFDEVAFWRDENSKNPDVEVHAAMTPGLKRIRGSMLILISSAHRRAGLLYDRWKTHYGKDDADIMVVRGTTLQFNPTFDRKAIEKALLLDPQRYGAEYNSEWRDDLATFLSRELIDSAVERGVTVRPPIEGIAYQAFCDPSGGVADAFTCSIAHKEQRQSGDRIVIDLLYEGRPPFNPSEIIADISALLKTYHISEVRGDRYAAQFVVEAFRKHGITHLPSHLDRSEIYLGFLPLATSGQLLLIDHQRALAQFAGLERRTFPSGKDRIDHPTGAHDDLSNAIAGAAVMAANHAAQQVPLVAPIVFGKDGSVTGATTDQQVNSTQKFYEWANSGHAIDWGPVGGGGGNYWGPV
jgi:hypothetical protein